MPFLIAVSLIWAFSFGIVGTRLAGIDSNFSAALRLGIACLCFLPFFRYQKLRPLDLTILLGIGALQLGTMYIAYMRAFTYLPSHLVALFSVFTPLYIVLTHDLVRRRWHWGLLGCALLSVAGAAVIRFDTHNGSFWRGFGLMQISNISFGVGQLLYRWWRQKRPEMKDSVAMTPLYLGGTLTAVAGFAIWGDTSKIAPTADQWYALLYLGAVGSGLGFFWWNKGAVRSTPGTLAACNNAVVPLAMAASLFLFGEAQVIDAATIGRLAGGTCLVFLAIVWGQKSGTPA